MTTEGPTSSSAPSSDFIKQWLRHVQNVNEKGPSTSAVLSQENIQELYGLQMEEVYSISQQLLTSQLPNEDYAAILLTHSQDVADLRDKIAEGDNSGVKIMTNGWMQVQKCQFLKPFNHLMEEYLDLCRTSLQIQLPCSHRRCSE